MNHRFVSDGDTLRFTCICGIYGTYAAVEQHIGAALAPGARATTDPYPSVVVKGDDFGGGNTQAHYLPVSPRAPASPDRDSDSSVAALPPPPSIDRDACPLCANGLPIADLPEIAAWSCGHWIRKRPRPIAEAFQAMLRSAYAAGELSARSGENFESWYQREVLQ
jgi:hypothetical protein